MQSFIVLCKNSETLQTYITHFCTEKQINQFDITTVTEETAIGIEKIRSIQQKIFLKPFKSQEKIVVIQNAHTLTVEAQNALLKLLEEPPEHTYIFLTAETESLFLPTILSRCKIIFLETQIPALSDEQLTTHEASVKGLYHAAMANKLYLAQRIGKDKQEALTWLEGVIRALHASILKQETIDTQHLLLLQQSHKSYVMMKTTNVNPRFILEHMLLNSTPNVNS